ncbi:MAG: hypothetical protein IKY18_03190 [Oscillospiraceae bacterium]|nr:hypothetical protein [Oscillospiraceae bacterium]
MKRNKLRISKDGRSKSTAIIIGITVALLLSVLLTVAVSNLVLKGNLSEKLASGVIFVLRAISVLAGTLIGGSILKRDYLILIGIIASVYLIMLIGIGIVFFNGSFKNFLLGVISVLVGGVVALIILQAPKGNRYKHKKIAL